MAAMDTLAQWWLVFLAWMFSVKNTPALPAPRRRFVFLDDVEQESLMVTDKRRIIMLGSEHRRRANDRRKPVAHQTHPAITITLAVAGLFCFSVATQLGLFRDLGHLALQLVLPTSYDAATYNMLASTIMVLALGLPLMIFTFYTTLLARGIKRALGLVRG